MQRHKNLFMVSSPPPQRKNIIWPVIRFVLLAIILLGILLPSSISLSASLIFFPIVGLFFVEIFLGRLSLISGFIFGVAYMVLPEAILGDDFLCAQWGEEHVRIGYNVEMLSFIAVYVGYFALNRRQNASALSEIVCRDGNIKIAWCVFGIIEITMVGLYLPLIINGLTSGRGGSLAVDVGFLGYFFTVTQYVILAFWGYYYSRENKGMYSLCKALALALPIFLIGIASGTRFFLCFQIMCLLYPWIRVLNSKKLVWGALGGLIILGVFTSMKMTRDSGFELMSISQIVSIQSGRKDSSDVEVMKKIARIGSTEGLIRNMAMISHWSTTHGHTYGKSIGFLGVFWIPRFVWEDKPTMLDYWLIREYEDSRGFSSNFSTASSFCGELFMDFGYFCIVICLGLGAILAKFDAYIERQILRGDFYSVAISGLFLGWSLFMARSIITASYHLILGGIVAFFFARVLLRERTVKRCVKRI